MLRDSHSLSIERRPQFSSTMLNFNLREVAPGEAIRADDWNALVGLLRELTDESNARELSVGEGLELHKSSSGSTLLLDVGDFRDFREEPESAYEHPFRVSAAIGSDKNGDPVLSVRVAKGSVLVDQTEWDNADPALNLQSFDTKTYTVKNIEGGKSYNVVMPMMWKTNYERRIKPLLEALEKLEDPNLTNEILINQTTIWVPTASYPPMPEGCDEYTAAATDNKKKVEKLAGENGTGAFETAFTIATIYVSQDASTLTIHQYTHSDITFPHRHGNW